MSAFLIGDSVMHPTDRIVAHAIEAASQRWDVPAALLRSLAYHDSGYNLQAGGLFQPRAQWFGREPVAACDEAGKVLSTWRTKYRGSWVHVLAAWYWSQHHVDAVRRGETRELPARVHRKIETVLEGAGMPRPFRLNVNGSYL